MRSAILLAALLLACGSESSSTSVPAPLAPVGEFGSSGAPMQALDGLRAGSGGSADEPADAPTSGVQDETTAAGASGSSVGGASGSNAVLGGAAGSNTQAGQGGVAVSNTGHAGSGGVAPLPFACPDPKPDDGISWTLYTVPPGECLMVGSSTWQGEQVCREASTIDGVCDAKCANYLAVRVGLFEQPLTIAVMPLFGAVLEGPPETVLGCTTALEGVFP